MPAPTQLLPDALEINSISAEEMTRGQRHQPGAWGYSLEHQVRRDLAEPLRLQRHGFDSVRRQRVPAVDVRGVIVGIVNDLISLFPRQAVCDQIQPEGCGTEQRDFIAGGIDKPCTHAADRLDLRQIVGAFLGEGSALCFLLQRGDRRAGEGSHSGVGQEDALLGNGEELLPERGVSEDVVDAQINLIVRRTHVANFAQNDGKAERDGQAQPALEIKKK